MRRLPVYILAGGRSSRFGSDKARALVHGRPLLGHVAVMLEPVASHITVVAECSRKYDDMGFHTIADHLPGLGPLAGLDAALADASTDSDWVLLCPCDALIIRTAWLTRLTGSIVDTRDAVAFRGDRWQPMPALYARRAAPIVRRQIERDQRSMQALLDRLNAASLPMPDDWPEPWQANTPSTLAEFRFDRDEH